MYSDITPDGKYIIAPAVWDSEVIIVDTKSGAVIERIATGLDPVTVKVSPTNDFAYVTNARDAHVTEINLKNFKIKNIQTAQGPNGLAITNFSLPKPHKILTLGVPLPLSGPEGPQGREMMLGYDLWNSSVNKSGGILIDNQTYDIHIIYLDTQSKYSLINNVTNELINKYHVNILLGTYKENLYNIEKEVAINAHIPITPFFNPQFKWDENNKISSEDIFITTKNFGKEFQDFYNLKASALSASAMESGIILQQALYLTHSTSYKRLMENFSKNNFQTFLSLSRSTH